LIGLVRAAAILAGLLVACPAFAEEESIAISDSLALHADPLIVKMGSQGFGQIPKWRIGDYAVVSSTLKATRVDSKSNLLETRTERHSTTAFTFVLCGAAPESVFVQVVRRAMDETTKEFKLGKSVGLGSNGVVRESDSCTATIVVRGDTSATWTLLKASISAPERSYEAVLTDGTRRVVLAPVTAHARPDSTRRRFFSRVASRLVPPAMGYEFLENGRSIGALQTFGGTSRKNPRRVWMHRDLDARSKLVLAAAMATILEVETSATGLEPPDESIVRD
jgi:hypothetical protein